MFRQIDKSIPKVKSLREAIEQSETRPIEWDGFIWLKGKAVIRWAAPNDK